MRSDTHCAVLLGALLSLLAAACLAAPSHAALVYQAPGSRVIAAANGGGDAHVLARGLHPAISPDGRWVAYLATDHRRVLLRSVAGGPAVVVARGDADPTGGALPRTAWSSDSQRIATVAVGRRLVVYDRRTRRSSTRRVFGEPGYAEPAFSPSGRRVAYVEILDVSGFVSWTTTTGPRRSVTLRRMGTNPVWGQRGLAMFEFDGSRYDQNLPSFVFTVATGGGHGHRLPGSANCLPVAWSAADDLLAACVGADRRERAVLLGIGRSAVPLAGGPVDRIVGLARDHRSMLAQDRGMIVRVDLASGDRRLLGRGVAPSWSA